MDDLIEKIKEFADNAHGNQKRKYTGERYIFHPIRVMSICREYTGDFVVLASALLHDVLEDTPVTKIKMKLFLDSIMDADQSEKILKLVAALTDVYTKEKFPLLNRKSRRNKEAQRLSNIPGDAQTVKYADIIDNADDFTRNDPDFAKTYLKECLNILVNMRKGNPELYTRTLQDVNKNLTLLA